MKLVEILDRGAVEVFRAASAFSADGRVYPAGTLVIPMAQPYRGYAKDLLEPQKHPDRRQGPDGPPKPPYDMAGWTLSYQMGIRTEASQRFEKGVDPEGVIQAMNRAAELMAACAGGTISPGIIDNQPVSLKPATATTVSTARTNQVLGTHLSKDDIKQTLASLAFTKSSH